MQTHSRAVWKPRVNPLTFLSTNSYRISGLDQEPVNPPAAENTTLSPVEVENAACVDVPVSRYWFLGMGGPSWCEWEQPPSSSSAAPAAQAAPGECHTLGCCHRNTPPKKHTKSHLFHHHLKEREGNLCKVLKGAGQWWWLHRHGPSPKFHQNLGDHCSVGSRGAAKQWQQLPWETGQSNREKTFTSDRCLHLISREHRELPPE